MYTKAPTPPNGRTFFTQIQTYGEHGQPHGEIPQVPDDHSELSDESPQPIQGDAAPYAHTLQIDDDPRHLSHRRLPIRPGTRHPGQETSQQKVRPIHRAGALVYRAADAQNIDDSAIHIHPAAFYSTNDFHPSTPSVRQTRPGATHHAITHRHSARAVTQGDGAGVSTAGDTPRRHRHPTHLERDAPHFDGEDHHAQNGGR